MRGSWRFAIVEACNRGLRSGLDNRQCLGESHDYSQEERLANGQTQQPLRRRPTPHLLTNRYHRPERL
ncbi:hypothetical protein D3C72_786180 [compost metagenome]